MTTLFWKIFITAVIVRIVSKLAIAVYITVRNPGLAALIHDKKALDKAIDELYQPFDNFILFTKHLPYASLFAWFLSFFLS